jgi:hypothetical protein
MARSARAPSGPSTERPHAAPGGEEVGGRKSVFLPFLLLQARRTGPWLGVTDRHVGVRHGAGSASPIYGHEIGLVVIQFTDACADSKPLPTVSCSAFPRHPRCHCMSDHSLPTSTAHLQSALSPSPPGAPRCQGLSLIQLSPSYSFVFMLPLPLLHVRLTARCSTFSARRGSYPPATTSLASQPRPPRAALPSAYPRQRQQARQPLSTARCGVWAV